MYVCMYVCIYICIGSNQLIRHSIFASLYQDSVEVRFVGVLHPYLPYVLSIEAAISIFASW